MKIVITGATGYLGREIIRQLDLHKEYKIYAATSSIKKAEMLFNKMNVEIVLNESLLADEGEIIDEECIIIHCAFCRQSIGSGLVQSLEFSRRLYEAAVKRNAAGIINLSSQSVYGSEKKVLGNEEMERAPGYLYALAKCGSEELLNQAISFSEEKTSGCNLRLAALVGISDGIPENIISKFAKKALSGEKISILGGNQKFSFLDVRDAAQAIILLLNISPMLWEKAYNLGPVSQTGILDMAELVINEAAKYTGVKVKVEIIADDKHELNAGMDSALLYQQIRWTPPHSFADIVEDTVKYTVKQS